eukprot:12131459-Ditylum_brightwellii.AAC.1
MLGTAGDNDESQPAALPLKGMLGRWQEGGSRQRVGGSSKKLARQQEAARSLPYMIFVVRCCGDTAGFSSLCSHERSPKTGNNPLAKGGTQYSVECDSHIKMCVLSIIPKF